SMVRAQRPAAQALRANVERPDRRLIDFREGRLRPGAPVLEDRAAAVAGEALRAHPRRTVDGGVEVADPRADRVRPLEDAAVNITPIPGEVIGAIGGRRRREQWVGLLDALPGDGDLQLDMVEAGGHRTAADWDLERAGGGAAGDPIALIVQAER